MNSQHVVALIERQALRVGEQIALVYKGSSINYHELNRRANQLAYTLRERGVGRESLVALALPKSSEVIIAMLAVWKAGGAYLPLDYQSPQARISAILKDSQAKCLITDTKGMFRFTDLPYQINVDDEEVFNGSAANLGEQIAGDQLAYVIYTSGSSGNPKGVMIEHRSLSHYLEHALSLYKDTSNVVSLFHSSIAFDLTITSLFLPLLVGGQVHIMAEEEDIEDLARFIHTQQDLNLLKLTPAHLKALNSYLDFSHLQDMCVIVGGELLSSDDVASWVNAKNVRVFNEYGPTETTVGCISLLITKAHLSFPIMPIGSALGNAKIYLLDKEQKPVGKGQVGEIYIAGPGLARGYLHQSELTDEKFIPNPFTVREDEIQQTYLKLYRSGDLAKYTEEGGFICLGREDEQVKIQGFRIELQEIENALNQHGDIAQCSIQAVTYGDMKKLVAYIVVGEFTPSELELKAHLALILPAYMIPTYFIYLEKIPLTLNGKVDKNALSLTASPFYEGEENEIEESCSSLEQQLKEIWKEVLKIKKLSIEDNFYRIGGDSIISLQLVAKARRAGLYFTVQDLFTYPTIASLASVVTYQKDAPIIKATPLPHGSIMSLSPIQRWFFQHDFQEKNYFNQAILLEASSSIEVELLNEAFLTLLEQHDALRYSFTQSENGKWKQTLNQIANAFQIKTIKLDVSSLEQIDHLINSYNENIQQSLDIVQGKLLEVVVFDCGNTASARILIVIHHLVVDAVSWRILVEDLEILYQDLKAKNNTALSPSSAYFEWMNTISRYACSEEMVLEANYWKKIEAQLIPFSEDFNLGVLSNQYVDSIKVSISAHDTLRLLQEVNKAYKTQINDILLTALVLATGDVTGNYRLGFCLEGHGREEEIGQNIDLSRTVGWFTSLFPVAINLEHTEDLGEVIKYVKENLRAIPRKGIGYGLRHYAKDETFFYGTSRPNLVFNYLGQWTNTSQEKNTFKFVENLSLGKGCVSSNNAPFFPLEVNAEIKQETLHIVWGYSTRHFKKQTIKNLADAFQRRLTNIIQYCCQPENVGYTPTDFTLVKLKQAEIDEHFSTLGELEDVYPLSSMQFGILFHHLYSPSSKNYFVQSIFKIQGHVAVDIMQQACQRVSDKHAILRTGFIYQGINEVVQYVVKKQPFDYRFENWTSLTVEDKEKSFQDFLKKEQEKGFNLESSQLCRAILLQTEEETYYFCWAQHHILLDGWSSSLILNDLLNIYKALYQGFPVSRINRPLFSHFIEWQKIKQHDIEAKNFWKNYLASLEDVTHLGGNSLVTTKNVEEYATCSSLFSNELTTSLTNFAQDNHLTMNTVLLAAVVLALKNYVPYQELVMGVTVSGRHPELKGAEDIAGLLINTLPLRVNDPVTTKIDDFLKNLQHTIQLINQYSYLPLAEIQTLANIDRHLFNAIFVFEKYPIDSSLLENPQLGFDIKEFIGIEHTEYPLTITALQGKDLEIILNYQTALFTQGMINRFLNNFLHILKQIITSSAKLIQDIESLSNEEKDRLIEWGTAKQISPPYKTLNELFEAQAKKTPHHIAIMCDRQTMSYHALNQQANQLAYYLRRQGVGRHTVVMVFCDRSLATIAAIIAILKVGAAYVPVENSYPLELLSYLLEDSQASFLITQSLHAQKLTGKIALLNIDDFDFSAYPDTDLPAVNNESDLAYIIYTSGSTGKPKGVMIEHASICARIVAYQDNYPLSVEDTVLCQTSLSFDVSLAEIFWPFSIGAKVVLSTQKGHEHLLALESLIFQHQVTFAQFVPSVLKIFLMHIDVNKNYALKCVCSGGEALDINIVQEFYKKLPNTHLENAYGPTEATVDAMIYPCRKVNEKNSAFVPIGRPLANGYGYILNPLKQLIPIGVVGELYLGGVTVARGYLNREELNSKSFLVNPFIKSSGQTSKRLYKTGDLCRWREDGQLEYVSRADNQIKIRGFRVELEEIEEVLLTHFLIKDAVVILKEDALANKQLIAYIVPREASLSLDFIRHSLSSLLPAHMIPNDFFILENMPLTANGKADRKKIAGILPQAQTAVVNLPRNSLEQELCQIWQQVLLKEDIGIYDNFFFVGGNSILATQLILVLRKQFSCDLSLASFFSEPTIANLAKVLTYQGEDNYSYVHTQIHQDITLAKGVTRQSILPAKTEKTGDILLTGANGFLGIHLLKELIQQCTGKIYCLLRGENEKTIRQRFIKSLEYHQLTTLIDDARIILILGDIGQAQLGITPTIYQTLVDTVSEIYHNGALVHHIYDYSRLQKENVHSTIELLHLASVGCPKKIHFISTLSTAIDKDHSGRALECLVEQFPVGNEGGYTLTKWTSEKILADAVHRGFDCTIHRLPQLMGHTHTGISPIEKIHINLLMRNWIKLGIAPKHQGSFEFLPVDFVANFIVKICRDTQLTHFVFNYGHPDPNTFEQVIALLNDFGYQIRLVDLQIWQQQALSVTQKEDALYPILSLYADKIDQVDKAENVRSGLKVEKSIIENLSQFVTKHQAHFPTLNKELWFCYFRYLQTWFNQ